jgi:hypothetical protein
MAYNFFELFIIIIIYYFMNFYFFNFALLGCESSLASRFDRTQPVGWRNEEPIDRLERICPGKAEFLSSKKK